MNKEYKPHKYQKEFHSSKARFRTFIAGRRGGKSIAGTVEALWYADQMPKEKGRPVHGWIISPTYQMLKDVNIPMLMEWCPPEAIKDFNKSDNKIELINGSTITLRSGENPDRLRGVGLDWVWLDEACFMSKAVWEVLYPTLTDKGGVAWVTTTPQGYDWVYDTFYKPAINKEPGFDAWKFTTLDNPYIDPELIEKAKKDLSDMMFKQEYLASFEKFEGLIYPDFNELRHIKETDKAITDTYFVALDVGWNHPTAAILAKEDVEGNLLVIDEFREQYLDSKQISDQLHGLLARNGLQEENIQTFVIDPASKGTQQTSGQSMMFQLQELGWGFVPANNERLAGINRVTRLLRENKLFIAKRCSKLIQEMNNYHWRKWNEERDTNRVEPFKLDDDLVDALRYLCISRPDYFEHPKTNMYGQLVKDEEEEQSLDEYDVNESIDEMMGGGGLL
jgi:PBSX family phage terminase large subunit